MRLNLEIPKEQMDNIRELQQAAGSSTLKDFVNSAFSLMEWALEESSKGNEIASVNEENDSYRVLVMPALQNAARKAAKTATAKALAHAG